MRETRDPPKMDLWLPEAAEFYGPAPQDDFDPNGAWQATYVILDNAPNRAIRLMRAEGYLRLRRTTPGDDGLFRLDVELVARKQRMGSFRTTIEVVCQSDTLSTPQRWKLSTVSLDAKDQPVEVTRVEESGRIEDGRIIRKGKRVRQIEAPSAVTGNWSLFDAVQRFAGREIGPVEFTMLEDFDLVKRGQRLTYWGTTEVELGAGPVRLVGYQQIGEGILPYHYWLDESGRLVFAYGALRGFLMNPAAAKPAVQTRQARRKAS
ncbi:MAG: hypothetical protein HQ582_20990 [Planctomycetes bacterium]|nr:hypothetical protein [Planctomycetota bacterium]